MVWLENNKLRRVSSIEHLSSVIRISFRPTKGKNCSPNLVIYIGDNVANRIGVKENDRVIFLVDDTNSRKWLVKKIDSDEGYKVSKTKTKNKKPIFLKFQVTFHKSKINLSEKDFNIRVVKHDLDHGGIVIFAD